MKKIYCVRVKNGRALHVLIEGERKLLCGLQMTVAEYGTYRRTSVDCPACKRILEVAEDVVKTVGAARLGKAVGA